MDEQILEARLELQNIRQARLEESQEFYKQREELRCGIDLLQSRIDDVLDVGAGVELFSEACHASPCR